MGMNMSIGCDVKECQYHHEVEQYCTLEQICIQKHDSGKTKEQTDCGSFKKK